jgi:hypothetical protein
MAQYARPIADVVVNAWTTQTGAASDLFAVLDEDAADETDFVQSSLTVNDAYECRLSAVPAALIDRGHVLRYRCRKNQALGNTRGVTVSLLQGSAVIATNSHPDLTALWQPDNAILLTPAQGALVTDYADLRVRFAATGTTGGNAGVRRRVQVAWVRLRVPDSTFGAVEDASTPGVWRFALGGVTGEGPRREDALVDLFTRLRDADPTDAVRQRRWHYVYYSRKVVDYTALRAQIAALPDGGLWDGQPKADALAAVDGKLATFDAITATADTEDAG